MLHMGLGDTMTRVHGGACGSGEEAVTCPGTWGGKRGPRQHLRLLFSILLDLTSHKKSSL